MSFGMPDAAHLGLDGAQHRRGILRRCGFLLLSSPSHEGQRKQAFLLAGLSLTICGAGPNNLDGVLPTEKQKGAPSRSCTGMFQDAALLAS